MSNKTPGQRPRPLLIVVSAPSGGGKTTLCDALLTEYDNLVYSVSCTTRSPRGTEIDGEDYIFMTDEGFRKRVEAGDFLEHATVHGYSYGTLRDVVVESLREGQSVLMDLDVQGARSIRTLVMTLPESDPLRRGFVDIFIEPPSIEILRERLEERAEDSPETIQRRLNNAVREMQCRDEFSYQVVNEALDRAYADLVAILQKEWNREP
ncbi:MAG: guanylate kinase [Lentisphaerae bacterium RIFOXYC12_FULL_60_16]|nr:MAG: guanylate kinase [Lentisphaerae bacterium RIFOXYC12_FULL_60_16]